MTSLYYAAQLVPPAYPRRVVRRFVELDDAIKYVERKTGLQVKVPGPPTWYFEGAGKGVKITGSQSNITFANRIESGTVSGVAKKFIINKVLRIPGAPDVVIVDILGENDPFNRELKILKYKLSKPEEFPEVKG